MPKNSKRTKAKPKTANRPKRTLKAGQTVEQSGTYQTDSSKMRMTLEKGEAAPITPLKNERWNRVVEMGPPKTSQAAPNSAT